MSKILYKSADVRREIIRMFSSSKGRRVAIVGFIGEGAEAYLPKPEGLHLICWPRAGGTNPNALRKLIKRGVRVSFADALHMKVYWAEGQGAIITSANLSTNALGAGNLKEIGILLKPEEIDIDRVIKSIASRPASKSELLKLDRLHKIYTARNPQDTRNKDIPSFGEWYDSPSRPAWKLGWWDSYGGGFSSNAKSASKDEYGVSKPFTFQYARRSEYAQGDWLLRFMLKDKSASGFDWMFTDFTVPVSRSDKKVYNSDYPHQAIQVWSRSRYPPPPFQLDKKFRNAFSNAAREFGAQRLRDLKTSNLPLRLIDLIHKYYVKT